MKLTELLDIEMSLKIALFLLITIALTIQNVF